jgi:phosphoserine phosphatase
MVSVTAAELVAALEGEAPGVVATDADGTLWSGDVGEDWLDAVAAGTAGVDDASVVRAAERLVGVHRSAAEVILAARAAYEAGALAEVGYFELAALTLTGARAGAGTDADHGAIRARIRASLVAAGLPGRLIAETRAVIEGARAHGHRVVVVSASPRLVVEEAVAAAGLAVDHVIGLELAEDGLSTKTPFPYADGKALLLVGHAGAALVHAALGDSAFDAAMLALARNPLAVRPRQALVNAAASVPGLRLLARTEPR